ncbi:MAG: gas vesicle protein [Dehalococcoidia bacterium]|nr:gas vesicle protein [Dehalococcoidia bacterium]
MATFQRVISPQATLVDLLDRVLDRGLIIDADIIISLAGVPLIGIKLRAALAGMETMVEYGLMREWDKSIREAARSSHKAPAPATGRPLLPGWRQDLAEAQLQDG